MDGSKSTAAESDQSNRGFSRWVEAKARPYTVRQRFNGIVTVYDVLGDEDCPVNAVPLGHDHAVALCERLNRSSPSVEVGRLRKVLTEIALNDSVEASKEMARRALDA